MKKQKLLLTALFTGLVLSLSAQQVRDIQVHVKGDKILLGYTISGLKEYQSISHISFFVSRDGGKTFEGPLQEISGDIGPELKNGKHVMVWDVLKEMPFLESNLVFDIRLSINEKKRKKAIMISLTGNMVTPFGLRVGQLGGIGWYVEGRGSLIMLNKPEYTYENGTIIDHDKPGYYEFNGNKGYGAWSALGGVTFEAHRLVFFNVGIGYGVENYLYEIDEYTYEPDTQTGTAWVKDEEYSAAGFELDAGMILKFNKFIITGGGTAINFKSFNWLLGVGVAF